ncbi:MAG: hypothetical protein CMP13_12270, partial [Zunongwangia sp.]|nr:hypothetical protein [Zunongwangia sp.]
MQTPVNTGVFLFLALSFFCMKIEVNIESVHKTVHKTSYTITMHDKKYTEVKLHIPKDKAGRPTVAPGNPWYIWFRWYNEKT